MLSTTVVIELQPEDVPMMPTLGALIGDELKNDCPNHAHEVRCIPWPRPRESFYVALGGILKQMEKFAHEVTGFDRYVYVTMRVMPFDHPDSEQDEIFGIFIIVRTTERLIGSYLCAENENEPGVIYDVLAGERTRMDECYGPIDCTAEEAAEAAALSKAIFTAFNLYTQSLLSSPS